MVKAGRYKGQQYGIPQDWGFDAILYRTDKVKPKETRGASCSTSAMRERSPGGTTLHARRSRLLPRHQESHGSRHSPAQAVSETARCQEERRQVVLVVGDRHAERVRSRRHLDRVRLARRLGGDEGQGAQGRYVHPKEGAISWIGMLMQGKDTPRPEHAHAYVDAWSSRQTGNWLKNNYAYGHANTPSRPKSKDLLRALQLDQPERLEGAERAHRQIHPEPAGVRQAVARGEGLLTTA